MNLILRRLGRWFWVGAWMACAQEYSELKSQGEALVARGNFAAANAIYRRIPTNGLPEADLRWVLFRRDDTGWRLRDAANLPQVEEAAPELARLGSTETPEELRDRVWAEAQESLGEFHWRQHDDNSWVQTRFVGAMDWWAGQTNRALARDRYLRLARMMELPPGWPGGNTQHWRTRLSDELLTKVLSVADQPADVAAFRLVHAGRMGQRRDMASVVRAEQEYERALTAAAGIPGRDLVLWQYAQWRESRGRLVPLPQGKWRIESDPAGAIKLYRQLLAEFRAGQSRWREAAEMRLTDLTSPAVSVAAPGTFLPESAIVFYVSGRNLPSLGVTVRAVDLVRDLKLPPPGQGRARSDWKEGLPTTGPVAEELTVALEAVNPHSWVQKRVILPKRLPAGAYLVEVTGAGKSQRDLLLVTDAAVVVQTSGTTLTAWVVEVVTGKPFTEIPIRIAQNENNLWRWEGETRTTDGNGLATFPLEPPGGNTLVLAGGGSRPALASTWYNFSAPELIGDWRIYAFTDRPAYRPGESIEWKFTARQLQAGIYRTPAQAQLGYEITGPQGNAVTNGIVTLNSFGSAWGSFHLGSSASLGSYGVRFFKVGAPENTLGSAELFRLEEYRLPEFEVTLRPPEEMLPDGSRKPKRLRAGEPITLAVSSRYYFGGPVPGGVAQIEVQKGNFAWDLPVPLDFPWLSPPLEDSRHRQTDGASVQQTRVVLDAQGQASFTFDPGAEGGDASYTFKVSVTEASRREVRAERTLRATVDGYAVRADPKNKLPRPGNPVTVEFRAQDANEQPVVTTGEVTLTRKIWWEVWLDSAGREISGDALKQKRAETSVWPPRVDPGMKEWTLKSQGYRSDLISTHSVATGTNGVGEWRFTPDREGYFQIAWESPDVWALAGSKQSVTNRIRTECVVWATAGAPDLGYRTEGLQLVIDRDSFRVGEKAPVLVVTANPGRWVWLTVDAGGFAGQQVFQMPGTTRLVELEITEQMVPNFGLQAASVSERKLFRDYVSVVVPPIRNFLQVEVIPERPENRPGSEGRLTVRTRNWEGQPVAAEVALSLVDESVFYIQSELAPDPRQFFFGQRRDSQPGLGSSFDSGDYRLWVRGSDDQIREGGGGGAPTSNDLPLDLERVVITGSLIPSTELAMDDAAAGRYALAASPMAKAMAEVGGAAPEPVVVVRRDFRATGLWRPALQTDSEGQVSVTFRYPDSTTRWLARGVAGTAGNQFGMGTNSSLTRSPLVVRLQTPRFLTTGDTAVISANLNNNTEQPMTVTAALAVQGVVLTGVVQGGAVVKGEPGPVVVPPGGEARVDWSVQADQAGTATFTVTARAGVETDGMERTVPIEEYGLEQLLARTGKATNDVTIKLDLPAQRRGPLEFSVSVTPSLAATMLDALPYLAGYPYGCTEQTLSRFLPAVIVRKTLRDLGLDAETVIARSFGGISTNAAGQVAPGLGARKDLLKLDDMVSVGLQRLYSFQHDNGAWGWWAEGPDDPWMTAYVVWGLRLAQDAGVVLEAPRLQQADRWLSEQLVALASTPDQAAWALHALAAGRKTLGQPAPTELERVTFDQAFSRRAELNAYSQALLALAAQRLGLAESARTLTEALGASAVREEAPDTSVLYGSGLTGSSSQATAHWGRTDPTWRWSDNGVEATAFVIRALVNAAPQNPQIDPAVTWLLKNRRGASWSNTRASAISLLALTDFLRLSGELKGDLSFEVAVNGRKLAEHTVKAGEGLKAPIRFSVPETALVAGVNTVELRRTGGTAPLYFAVEARFFSQEKPIRPAATDLFVRRDYFRLVPVPTLLDGVIDERIPLLEGDALASGDRVEARLVVETQNDLEYLLLEDLKPAGLEAIEVQSGYRLNARELTPAGLRHVQSRPETELTPRDRTGREEGLYVEWRDRRAAVFASRLTAGGWEIRVPYRAETPGRFAALPAVGAGMYAPEIRGNSSSQTLEVKDSAP